MDRIMKYGGQYDGTLSLAEVPIGWQRKIHHTGVVYVSPSGSVLACLEQVKTYLLTDGTCKCGLECPLILHKIFNYNPGAVVKLRTAEDAQADAEVTKLCIHKRKIIAVATLHRSMEPSHLSSSGNGMAHVVPLNHHAIRNNMLNCPSNSIALDKKNPYKMPMLGEQFHQCELSSPPQINVYTGHSRSRLGGSDHSSQRSPYRSNHSVLLSPPSSNPCGSQRYCDGTPSPRPENLRSPDPSVHGFHGALSPCSSHLKGEHFTPLSQQPGISLQSSPSAAQPSCTMAGRTNVSLSSSVNVKNPNTQKSPCSFPHNVDYQHKLQHACHSQSHLSMSQLLPCIVQKKQVVSEKDPLGILDPIPSKAHCQEPPNRIPASFQFHSQPQVSSMNVKIPPTIVPLPSNLPLPTVKSGPVGHVQRAQNPTPSSVSSSPVISPEHVSGPNPARVEETQHNSRCSSLTSDHSSFVHAQNVQVSCGSAKLPSRAQRASMVSPRPSLPLHHLKEASNQQSISSGISRLHSSKCLPATGPDISHPNKHSTGVAHQQLLNQQNPSSYPASTLLSAAAKAQLGNQNKCTDTLAGAEGQASQGPPGLVGGGRQRDLDGQSTLIPRYLPNTGPFTGDSQSGRAALRDKLMAQQRGVVRKRKQPSNTCSSDMTFGMHEQRVPGSVSSGFPGSMRRVLQQGGLPPNTSMAQLLQSMSHQNQSAQNGLKHVDLHPARSNKSPFFEETVTQMSTLPSNQGPTQVQARTELNCQNIKSKEGLNVSGNLSIEQFASAIDQLHDPAFGGNFEAFGYPKQPMRSMVNPNSHKQHFGQYHKGSQGNIPLRDRTGLPSMMSNGGVNTLSESGAPYK